MIGTMVLRSGAIAVAFPPPSAYFGWFNHGPPGAPRSLPPHAGHDARAGGTARAGRLHRPVDDRSEPGQVAPGPHHLVLRNVRAARNARLSLARRSLPLPLQLVLRRSGRATPAERARALFSADAVRGLL